MEIGQNDNLYETIGHMQSDAPATGKKQGGWGLGAAFSKLTGSSGGNNTTTTTATTTSTQASNNDAKGGLFNRFQSPQPKPDNDDDEEPHSGNFWNNLNSNNHAESESEDERPMNANKQGWTGFLGGTPTAEDNMDESDYDTDVAGEGVWTAPIVVGTPKSTLPTPNAITSRKSQVSGTAVDKSPIAAAAAAVKGSNNRTQSTEENSESESDAESTAPVTDKAEQGTNAGGGFGLGAFLDKGKESAIQAELGYMMNPDPDDKSMADMSLVSNGMDPAAQQRLLQQRMDMSFEKSVCTMSLNPEEAQTKERRPWREHKNLRRGSQLGAMPLNAGMLGSMDQENDEEEEEEDNEAALYNMSTFGMGMSHMGISHRPLHFGDDQSIATGTVGFDDVWKDGTATVTTEMPELDGNRTTQTESDLSRKLKQVASKQKPTKTPSLTPKQQVDTKELTSLFPDTGADFVDNPTSMFTTGNNAANSNKASKTQDIPSDSGHSSKGSGEGQRHRHSTSKSSKNEAQSAKSLASELTERTTHQGLDGDDKNKGEGKHSSRTEKVKGDGESERRSKRGKSKSHGGHHHDNGDHESSRKKSSGRPPRTPDGTSSTDDRRFRKSDENNDERRTSRKSDDESGEERRSRRHKSKESEDEKLDGSRQSRGHRKSNRRDDDGHNDDKDNEKNDDEKRSRRKTEESDKEESRRSRRRSTDDGRRTRRRSKDDDKDVNKDADTDADKDDKRRSRRKSRVPRSDDDDSRRKHKDSRKSRSKSGSDAEKIDDSATSPAGLKSEVKPWRQPKKEVGRSDSLGDTDKHENSALSSLEARSRAASTKAPEKKSNSLTRENSKQGSTDTGKTEDTHGSGVDGNSPIKEQPIEPLKRIDSKAKGKRGSLLSALGLKKKHHSKLDEDEDANEALLKQSGEDTKDRRPNRLAGSGTGVGISLLSSGEHKKKSKIPGEDATEKKGLLGSGEKKSDEGITDRKSETDKKGRRRRSTSVPKSVDKTKESKGSRESKGGKDIDGSKRRSRRSKSVPVRDSVMDDASSGRRTKKKSSTDNLKQSRKVPSGEKRLSSTGERSHKKSSRDKEVDSPRQKKSLPSEDEKSRKSKRTSGSRIRD